MTPGSEPRPYARRRRAAVPVALAAFVALVVLSGSRTPASVAGSIAPPLTVVLPAQPASSPADSGSNDSTDTTSSGTDTTDSTTAATPPADTAATDTGDQASNDGSTPGDSGKGGDGGDGSGTGQDNSGQVAIRHVFLVMLADTDLVALAGDAGSAPYLASTLAPKGTLLTQYRSVARGAVANGVALLSGQGPTAQTLADCPAYADVTPDQLGDDGQQLGDGCVYPPATGTVVEQLHAAGLDWRAYVEDVGAGAADGTSQPSAADATCRHPAPGSADPLRDPRPGDAYATRRNPFAYFHSLLDSGACAADDVGLDKLDADLARGRHAPAFSYIVPNLCHDGRATPCATGATAGPAAADAFLKALVPKILASPAYADHGLLVVTSDQPPPSAPAPTTACCTPTTYPNVGDAAAAGAGRVGALLISATVRHGATSSAQANHFTLLRLLSDLFQLQPLGYAGASDMVPLPERLLTAPAGDAGP